MDETMKQFQESLMDIEIDAEHLLLARHQVNLSRPTNFCFELFVLVPKQEREKINKNWNLSFDNHLYSLFNGCVLVLELKSVDMQYNGRVANLDWNLLSGVTQERVKLGVRLNSTQPICVCTHIYTDKNTQIYAYTRFLCERMEGYWFLRWNCSWWTMIEREMGPGKHLLHWGRRLEQQRLVFSLHLNQLWRKLGGLNIGRWWRMYVPHAATMTSMSAHGWCFRELMCLLGFRFMLLTPSWRQVFCFFFLFFWSFLFNAAGCLN